MPKKAPSIDQVIVDTKNSLVNLRRHYEVIYDVFCCAENAQWGALSNVTVEDLAQLALILLESADFDWSESCRKKFMSALYGLLRGIKDLGDLGTKEAISTIIQGMSSKFIYSELMLVKLLLGQLIQNGALKPEQGAPQKFNPQSGKESDLSKDNF